MLRKMTKRIALILFLATLVAQLTLGAAAQEMTIVKGTCTDQNGKPVAAATVEFANVDNGSKTILKTDSHGQYYSAAVPAGNYKITLTGTDGKINANLNATIKAGAQNVTDFAFSAAAETKESEKVKKDNEKIKSTNLLLLQAAQQKKDKQYDSAVATMEQAAAQDQTHDVVYGSLADAYSLDKKFPEAEAAYTKALSLAPATSKSLANYHAGLALALLQQGKIDDSTAECEKTAQIDPKQAGQCYYNEGAILTNQGKADDANQAFDRAIAADPTRADAYYQKGVNLLAKATLDKDNKMVPAPGTAEALNKYLELAPDGQYAQAAKDLLASIGAPVQTSFGTQKKGKK
jgi:tetratricopeptide (TPR) repeat protein